MIKAKLSDGTLILGLSNENVRRLMMNQPILFDARPMGYEGRICIMFGETERAILDQLQAAGVATK